MVQNVGNYINDNQRYKDVRKGKWSNVIIQICHVNTSNARPTDAAGETPEAVLSNMLTFAIAFAISFYSRLISCDTKK